MERSCEMNGISIGDRELENVSVPTIHIGNTTLNNLVAKSPFRRSF
jgi:hypothetical protein